MISDVFNEKDLAIIEGRISYQKMRLNEAEKNNFYYESNKTKLDELRSAYGQASQYKNALEIIQEVSSKEYNRYKKRRTDVLCGFIDANLSVLFSDFLFKSEIECDFKYRQDKARLVLKDKYGRSSVPKLGEGMCCKQLISFSASASLCECLGLNKMYLDECFAAACPENLTKLGPVISNLVDRGMQLFLVAQEDYLYKDIPHREIRIKRSTIDNTTHVVHIKDY